MRSKTEYGDGFFTIIKGTLLALAVSLLGAVGVATFLQTGVLNETWVYTIHQFIKAVAILVGVFTFVRGEKGWLKGGGVGILFTGLSYLAFSALGGDFSLGWLIFVELLTAFLVGAIGGILAVNLKK
jgi:putative membrane protein (TIGR04086 family)